MKNKTCGNQLLGSTVKTASVTLLLALSGASAFAAATASDTAANYAGTWSTTPANLGTGFGAWSVSDNNSGSGPYAGTYLDQTSYGNSDGVLSGGYAWGTYANGGSGNGYFDMTRSFLAGASGSASLYNQTFSIAMGTSGVGGAGSAVGVDIGTAFSIGYIAGGGDNMSLSVDGGAESAVPVTYAQVNSGLLISLAVSGALNSTSENYTLTLSPFAGGAAYDTITGTFDSLDYNTASFTMFDDNTSNDGFYNNPTITAETPVPEPSTLALMTLSGLATLRVIRRRK